MRRGQRLLHLAMAGLIAVVAAVLLLALGGDGGDEPPPVPTVTETSAGGESSSSARGDEAVTPEPTPEPPLLRPQGEPGEIEVVEGDAVRFRVQVDEDDSIHVHGYDIERALEAGRTRTVAFEADITGIFEIELHHAQPPLLATLKVEPRG